MAPPAADSSWSRSQASCTIRVGSGGASCRPPASSSKSPPSSRDWDLTGPAGTTSTNGKKTNTPEFLLKLYRILQQEPPEIISWDNGRIHVRNPSVLGQEILHKYFRHSKYSSFQRQLNYFGFRKTQGKGKMSACTYTNIQLHGGSLKSLLGCKRKTSSLTSTTPAVSKQQQACASSSDDEKDYDYRDDDIMLSDDESDTGPAITQPLKRQRSMSTASIADSVATTADGLLDDLKSDDEADDLSSPTDTQPVARPAAAAAATASNPPRVQIPAAIIKPEPPAPSSLLPGNTPRGSSMEFFFERDYRDYGVLPSPRTGDELFLRSVTSVNGLFDLAAAGAGEQSWSEPPTLGSLEGTNNGERVEITIPNPSVGQSFSFYGDDEDVFGSGSSDSESSPESSSAENNDAFWWAKFPGEAS